MTTDFEGKRITYRVSDVEAATGLKQPTIYSLAQRGVIPTMANCGACVVVPAWAVESWLATGGDWLHPDYVPPGYTPKPRTTRRNKKTPAADTARA